MKFEGKTLKESKKREKKIKREREKKIIITLLYLKRKHCFFHLIRDLTYEYRRNLFL